MNTLQSIADLQSRVSILESKFSAMEILATNAPALTQEITSAKTDIAQLTAAMQNIVQALNKKTGDFANAHNITYSKVQELSQILQALTKNLTILTSELIDSNIVSYNALLTRFRKSEEVNEKNKIQQLQELQVIAPETLVAEDSLIVIKQEAVNVDGTVDIITEYQAIESGTEDKLIIDIRNSCIGKTVGDVIELNLGEVVIKSTILEIYKNVSVLNSQDQQVMNEQEAQ